jgi:hypothetical protein
MHRSVEIFTRNASSTIPNIGSSFGGTVKWEKGNIGSVEHFSSTEHFPDTFEEFGLTIKFFKRVSELIPIPEEVTDLRCIIAIKELI